MKIKQLICILFFTLGIHYALEAANSVCALPLDSLPTENILLGAEEMPSFAEGEIDLEEYIQANLQYPSLAKVTNVEGTVYVKFVVLKDGSIHGVRIVKGVFPITAGLNKEAIRIVESMPKWIPASDEGIPVAVYCHLPIRFSLDSLLNKPESVDSSHLELKEGVVYETEVMPEFPGGQSELFNFLAKHMRYPPEARRAGIGGTVYVGYVVMEDGSINNIRIKRGLPYGGETIEAEALRVIELMPDWKPGIQDGEPVRVAFTIPLRFKLEGMSRPKKKKKRKRN